MRAIEWISLPLVLALWIVAAFALLVAFVHDHYFGRRRRICPTCGSSIDSVIRR